MRLVMVDAGGSNLSSVQAAFSRLGVDAVLSSNWDDIVAATHVVLPGVGAAIPAMQKLRKFGLVDKIPTLTQPVLGVCVGMQIMFASSEEGDVSCLGIFADSIRKLPNAPGIRIPHMGWNMIECEPAPQAHPILRGLDRQHAYFVHSFAAPIGANTLATCEHGTAFSAVVARANFIGAQFHPERSQSTGARLLQNFLELA